MQARANRRPPRTRRRKPPGRRAWLLLPIIILAVLLGWLYRNEILNLVTFRFQGIDFTEPPAGKPVGDKDAAPITEKERKELEKILKTR